MTSPKSTVEEIRQRSRYEGYFDLKAKATRAAK